MEAAPDQNTQFIPLMILNSDHLPTDPEQKDSNPVSSGLFKAG